MYYTGDEHVHIAKLDREYSYFLNELKKSVAVSIQQAETETEINDINME